MQSATFPVNAHGGLARWVVWRRLEAVAYPIGRLPVTTIAALTAHFFFVLSEWAFVRRCLGDFISETGNCCLYRFQLFAFLDYVVLDIVAIGASFTWWI